MYEALSGLETEVAHRPATLSEQRVISKDHPAFASGDKLVGVEAECANVAETPARTASVGLPVHLCGILNDLQSVLSREGQHRIHFNRQTIDMNDHYCLCARCYSGSYSFNSCVPGVGLAVNEHR